MNREAALILLALITLSYPSLVFGTEKETGVKDKPPGFFVLFSASGNERFVVACMSKEVDSVRCEFDGLRINPPDTKEIEEIKRRYERYEKEAMPFHAV